MHFGYHHYQKRKSSGEKTTGLKNLLDKTIYLGAFVAPILLVPQLLKIWQEKNATGVSLLTWLGYLGGTVFWLFYGLVHKQKPIILANITFGLLTLFIVIGILLYSH